MIESLFNHAFADSLFHVSFFFAPILIITIPILIFSAVRADKPLIVTILSLPFLIAVLASIVLFLIFISERSGYGVFGIFVLPAIFLSVFLVSFLIVSFIGLYFTGLYNIKRFASSGSGILRIFIIAALILWGPLVIIPLYHSYSVQEEQARIERQKVKDDKLFWVGIFKSMNASLPFDTYKSHYSQKNKEVIQSKVNYDKNGKITAELLRILHQLSVDISGHKNIDRKSAEEIYASSVSATSNYGQLARLARNPGTPVDILKKICTHKNYHVLRELAINSAVTVEILEKLITDAKGNLSIEEGKEKKNNNFINENEDLINRAEIALGAHKDTSFERLKELLKTGSGEVRESVITNAHLPVNILQEIALKNESKDYEERKLALLARKTLDSVSASATDKFKNPDEEKKNVASIHGRNKLSDEEHARRTILAKKSVIVLEENTKTDVGQKINIKVSITEEGDNLLKFIVNYDFDGKLISNDYIRNGMINIEALPENKPNGHPNPDTNSMVLKPGKHTVQGDAKKWDSDRYATIKTKWLRVFIYFFNKKTRKYKIVYERFVPFNKTWIVPKMSGWGRTRR